MLEKALLYVLEILILKLASSLKWKLLLFFKINESMYLVHLGKNGSPKSSSISRFYFISFEYIFDREPWVTQSYF